jgi:hypothetical protein
MIEFAAGVQQLWTVRKDGPEAAASVRAFAFSCELRVTVGPEPVFTRQLQDGDDEQAMSADILRTFLNDGWMQEPQA